MQGGKLKNRRPTKVVNVKENHVVAKSNQLVEARYRLSLREQRFILIMASMIEPKDTELQFYKVPSGDLIRVLGWENEHDAYKRLRDLIRGLQRRLLIIKRPNKKVLETQWVGSAEYEPGFVEFEFSAKLKPYLLQLKEQFTRYKLKNIVQLQSVYSIRLYELLKQYETIGIRRITLEELREYLDLKSKAYDSYGNIKNRVLKPAQSEIEKSTDISFTFDEIKHSRKVVELRFTIKPSKSKESLFPAPLDEPLPLSVKEMVQAGVSKRVAMKIWREKWGFLDDEARQQITPLISDGLQFEQYIRDKLELLNKASKQAEIPSRGGWISRALKENWTNTEQDKKRNRAKRTAEYQRRVREEDERRHKEDDRLKQEQQRKVQLEGRYLTLSPASQSVINQRVHDQMLTSDEFKLWRGEITRMVDAVDSGASFFEKLPSGAQPMAKLLMHQIVEAEDE